MNHRLHTAPLHRVPPFPHVLDHLLELHQRREPIEPRQSGELVAGQLETLALVEGLVVLGL